MAIEFCMKELNKVVSRLAPTPSGFLHLGNIFNFVLTWVLVRRRKGILHLRIDDIDQTRVRDEFIEDVFKTIDWLNLDYDKGPSSVEEFKRYDSQVLKNDYYRSFLKKSKLFYSCTCSRKDVQDMNQDGIYHGYCLKKMVPFNTPGSSIRVHVPEETWVEVNGMKINLYDEMGDFVIWRKDGLCSYQLMSLIEDMELGVNFIVRGEDLLSSSAGQLYLANHLSMNDFSKVEFIHHPLIMGGKGQKLSKSNADQLYKENVSKSDIYTLVGQYLGVEGKVSKIGDLLL